jgi:hypothetical protein
MTFARLVFMQCRRALWSPVFLVTVCIFTVVLILNGVGAFDESAAVAYLFNYSMMQIGVLVICILPILPFGISYAREYREKSVRFYCIRAGVSNYTSAKFIAVVLSGFLVVFLGLALFGLILSICFPLNKGSGGGGSFEVLLAQNKVFLYLFCFSSCYALSGALFAGLAYWFSTWYDERYSVVILPYLFYMIIALITNIFNLPYRYTANPWFVDIPVTATPLAAILLKLCFVGFILLLLCYDIMRRVERRILSE